MRKLIILLPLLGGIAGCTPLGAAVSAGAHVGSAAAEERGFSAAVDDAKIELDINHLWFQSNFEMYRSLSMSIKEGRVMITGEVPTPEARVEAVRLAWQAPGVKEVLNEVQVVDQSGVSNYSSDIWIANKLRRDITFDKYIKAINYSIDTVNSVIYIMGIAQSQAELDLVLNYARSISGVRKVVNHVVMKDDPSRKKPETGK